MDFRPVICNHATRKRFEGSLPTSIFEQNNISEVFGANPDIDSTALMISTTSWILAELLEREGSNSSNNNSSHFTTSSSSSKYRGLYKFKPSSELNSLFLSTRRASDFVIPKMNKAIDCLTNRDIDDDGLLEQDHNEDWMDSVMRRGKIVYSNASWILALRSFCKLLVYLKDEEDDIKRNKYNDNNREQDHYYYNTAIDKMEKLANKAVAAVEQKLWSNKDGCYIDLQQEEKHIGGPYRTLTQDVVLYLIANMEGIRKIGMPIVVTNSDRCKNNGKQSGKVNRLRAVSTLNAIKIRIWKENKWPLVTEVELKKTGPWMLKPYQYHNYTIWPWITALEVLARNKFGQIEERNVLLSNFLSKAGYPVDNVFYEWIDPISKKGRGANPFRTGISSIRIALFNMLKTNNFYQNSR